MILFSKNAKAAECSALTTCGNSCSYGGVLYDTVKIGTQCWFKENLNIGTMLTNATIMPDDIAPIPNQPNTVQKWCFDNSLTYCTDEGGLYTWAEANGLPNSCNSTSCSVPTPNQGICPIGWHIPTDTEQYTLENYLTTPGQTCDSTRSDDNSEYSCSGAGDKLMLGGSSGFNALLVGHRDWSGYYNFHGAIACYWSSSPSDASYAWNRCLTSGYSTVYRNNDGKIYGSSIRCLSNTVIVGPPTNKEQCMKDGWKVFTNPTFKNQGACVSYIESNQKAGKRN